jgi:hypothetical protein
LQDRLLQAVARRVPVGIEDAHRFRFGDSQVAVAMRSRNQAPAVLRKRSLKFSSAAAGTASSATSR